jgi:uncharacterized repeat protein (TIGR03917 family)
VAVRRATPSCYEVTLSPGADVADLVAAVGVLPPGVVYTDHRPAPPGKPAATAVLVFQAPAAGPPGTADPGGVPAHPSPTGRPPRLLHRPLVEADADRAGAVPVAAEHATAATVAVATPAAVTAHERPVVRAVSPTPIHTLTPAHRDPDTPPTTFNHAIPRAQQAA